MKHWNQTGIFLQEANFGLATEGIQNFLYQDCRKLTTKQMIV